MASTKTTNPTLTPSAQSESTSDEPSPDPYFLSNSDNPGSILVTQPLLGTVNY